MYEADVIYSFTDYPWKTSPGLNIDVYLQPLIHELKLLWDGVVVFYAYSNEYFNMRAVLRCTINDFPAYAMLSGWSTKGYKACPQCASDTHSYMFGGKTCYVGTEDGYLIIILIVVRGIYLMGLRNIGMFQLLQMGVKF